MWGRMVLVVLMVAACACGPVNAQENLRLGAAVNVFSRYGYLSISMRVVPRNDTDRSWIFREPTVHVFRNLSIAVQPVTSVETYTPVFNGDYHMEFCDNLSQLLQAYFRDFYIQRMDKSWKAFTASWSKAAMARHLGINTTYITDQHSYVLVRVARHRTTESLSAYASNREVENTVSKEADKVVIGDTASVMDFVRNFGTHYIASYVTGNSLYQVFVYKSPIYLDIKERVNTKGVKDVSALELLSFFSPWNADHIGKVQSASGNIALEEWATEILEVDLTYLKYASLIKVVTEAPL
ncbi:hypothetical protein L9F63_024904, partial [Diploptera punctata]